MNWATVPEWQLKGRPSRSVLPPRFLTDWSGAKDRAPPSVLRRSASPGEGWTMFGGQVGRLTQRILRSGVESPGFIHRIPDGGEPQATGDGYGAHHVEGDADTAPRVPREAAFEEDIEGGS